MMEDSQEGQGGPVFGAAGESYDSTYTNKTCRGSSDFFFLEPAEFLFIC